MADISFIPALFDMGTLFAENGKPEKALYYFTKAAKLTPNNPAAHYNLSLVYEMLGRSSEAALEMKRFQELNLHGK